MPKSSEIKTRALTAEEARAERAAERHKARQAALATPKVKPVSKTQKAWDKARTRELFARYKQNEDLEARQELASAHQNLVRFIANKYRKMLQQGTSLDDLIQVGNVGLIKAIDRFDPEKGNEFTTFATPTIDGEIKRYFRDHGWDVRVPRSMQELSSKVKKATDELTQELQTSPSVEQIADYLGISVEQVLEAQEASAAYSAVSFDGLTSNDDDDAPSIESRYGMTDHSLETKDDSLDLTDIISEFSPREQEVIKMRFYEELSQVEIAEKLGISQVQVSRLLRRTLQKIRDKLSPEGAHTA